MRPMAVAVGIVLLAIGPSAAATITFGSGGSSGFDGVGDLGNSISVAVGGGITLTVTASGCTSGPCIITSSSTGGPGAGFGYGVNDAGGATDGANLPELGGPPEFLSLQFSSPVRLLGFSLEDVDDGSDNGVIFSRVLPSALVISSVQNVTDGANPFGSTYDSGAATYQSEVFSVQGTEFEVSASSGEYVRLRSISFLPTPEPSTWALVGITSLALLRWRRRKQRSKT